MCCGMDYYKLRQMETLMRNFVLLGLSISLSACQPQEPPSAFGTLERERVLLTAPATEMILTQSAQEGSKIKGRIVGRVLEIVDKKSEKCRK